MRAAAPRASRWACSTARARLARLSTRGVRRPRRGQTGGRGQARPGTPPGRPWRGGSRGASSAASGRDWSRRGPVGPGWCGAPPGYAATPSTSERPRPTAPLQRLQQRHRAAPCWAPALPWRCSSLASPPPDRRGLRLERGLTDRQPGSLACETDKNLTIYLTTRRGAGDAGQPFSVTQHLSSSAALL